MSLSTGSLPDVTQLTVASNDGTHIYAESMGDPSKPAIIFIHALTMSSHIFTPIFEDPQWSERLHLVRYDLRGHGRSGKPAGDASYESKRFAEDFDAVLTGFGLKKPFVLGNGPGTSIITDILTFHPRTYLSGIIYVGGVPYFGQGAYVAEKVLPKEVAAYISLVKSPDAMARLSIEQYQENARSCCIDVMGRSLPYPYQRAWLGDVMLTPIAVMTYFVNREQDEKGLLKARDEGLPLLLVDCKLVNAANLQEMLKALGEWKTLKVVEMAKSDNLPWFSEPDSFRKGVINWLEQVSKVSV